MKIKFIMEFWSRYLSSTRYPCSVLSFSYSNIRQIRQSLSNCYFPQTHFPCDLILIRHMSMKHLASMWACVGEHADRGQDKTCLLAQCIQNLAVCRIPTGFFSFTLECKCCIKKKKKKTFCSPVKLLFLTLPVFINNGTPSALN